MDYTPAEQNVLSLMNRTNFKNLSKNDVVGFASKLAELRPEVAREVLAQYPEYVKLMQSTIIEYKNMLDAIVKSDDESLEAYYGVANRELDSATDSRKQYYDLIKQVQSDYSRCLNNPNLPPETVMEILNKETELVKMADAKDTEIRGQEAVIEASVNKKDAEKRGLNWKFLGTVSLALVSVVGISAGILGGKFDFKLPNKN